MLTPPRSPFNLTRFKSQMAQEFLRGTRSVGWARRAVFDEQMLDPYIIWRHLQFQRLKIPIRDAGLARATVIPAMANNGQHET
jgi:hypothetical protein